MNILRVKVTCTELWDSVPPIVHFTAELEYPDHTERIADRNVSYYEMHKSDCVLRELSWIMNLIKVKKPSYTVLEVCDLAAFLYLTKQANPPYQSTRACGRVLRRLMNKRSGQILLGDPQYALTHEQNMIAASFNRKCALTTEQMGFDAKEHYNEQTYIRRRLGLWQNSYQA